MGVWLPKSMCPDGTEIYAHAVEVPADYSDEVPRGFDVIELPPCKYLVFQGEPYDDNKYDETAPKFQLAPMGWRGYIEGRAVKKIADC